MKEVVHSNISKPDEFNHIILGTQCLDSQDDSHQISRYKNLIPCSTCFCTEKKNHAHLQLSMGYICNNTPTIPSL